MANYKDISFKNEQTNFKFNFRVAAVITYGDKVLLQKSVENDYHVLIGGRLQYGETTLDALIREVKEETGITIPKSDAKLIDVVENIFPFGSYKYHELLFVYRIMENKDFFDKGDFTTLDKETSFNKWYSIEEAKNLHIEPSITKELFDKTELNHDVIVEE